MNTKFRRYMRRLFWRLWAEFDGDVDAVHQAYFSQMADLTQEVWDTEFAATLPVEEDSEPSDEELGSEEPSDEDEPTDEQSEEEKPKRRGRPKKEDVEAEV